MNGEEGFKGAVKVAKRSGIGEDEITTLLREFDLTFDQATDRIADDWLEFP
jgi:hypothetical protein